SAGVIGSFFTTPNIATWYESLNKPWFTPPSWVFGPVWTTLFILMGISLFLVLREGWERKDVQIGTAIFGIQLVLNILWSYLFFGLRSPLYGLIGIAALWIAILVTIIWFFRISRPAAILLVPYIIWVSIASALNYGIYVLNP
ncbi:MAG: tryptophan-rich sensory protein, partial [Methanoregulaceae archaeon]|nr:tryptophan-rich sensory protein [Methanoregulaceae archaeon]